MLVRRLSVTFGICAALLAGGANARGVSPYLPLQLSPEIERQVEQLLLLADKPILTRPIALATVFDALPKACERDVVLCDQVKRYLAGFMRVAGIGHASLGVAGTSSTSTALPNHHGMNSDSTYELAVQAYWQPSDYVLMSIGGVIDETNDTPTGTMVSLGVEFAQFDIGYRDHWLSPLTDSAMLIGTEAATMPSITVSNYTPMSRWGFRYEFFLAEMSDSERIATEGGYTSGNPLLAGMHLSIEPLPGWSIGVNRLMQFGGGDRDQSFGSFVEAFFDPSGADNTGTASDFGNQLASFSSRFLLPGRVPVALYFDYAGEDTSTLNNFRLGNTALAIGVDIPQLIGNVGLTVEVSEWQNGWYTNHIYQDGLRNEGHVLGHWGGDWRAVDDDVGASSWMIRVRWQPKVGILDGTYRSIQNEDYTLRGYERGYELDMRYSVPLKDVFVGAELTAASDVFGESFARIGGFVRF